MSFWDLFRSAGPVMYVIAFCFLIVTFIFVIKWFQFHRAEVNIGEFISGLENVLSRDGVLEAISLCDNTPGPVARILNSAIQAYQCGDDIELTIEDHAPEEVARLESSLNILATVAYVAPLLGLLGTVIGMFQTFHSMTLTDAGGLGPEQLQGVYTALICTAAGLCLAIPCHIAYNYLLSRVQHFCMEMEKASARILHFFRHHQKNGAIDNAAGK